MMTFKLLGYKTILCVYVVDQMLMKFELNHYFLKSLFLRTTYSFLLESLHVKATKFTSLEKYSMCGNVLN